MCTVALGKFNEGVVTYDADGEVELDLEKVDYASLMEVSHWLRGEEEEEWGGDRRCV